MLNKEPRCVVRIWFKDYLFTYEEEYLVCNWTCFIGEIGGNLGFFLGGSLLGMSDTILGWMAKYQRAFNMLANKYPE